MQSKALTHFIAAMAVVSTLGIYIAEPLWPQTVARFPWKVWGLPFLSVCLLAQLYLFRGISVAKTMAAAAIVLAAYFFLEAVVGTFLFYSIDKTRMVGSEGFLFVGAMNILTQCAVLAVWIVGIGLHAYMRRNSL